MIIGSLGGQDNPSCLPCLGHLKTDTDQANNLARLIVFRLIGQQIPLFHPALCFGVVDFLQRNIDIFREAGQDRPDPHSAECFQGNRCRQRKDRYDDDQGQQLPDFTLIYHNFRGSIPS